MPACVDGNICDPIIIEIPINDQVCGLVVDFKLPLGKRKRFTGQFIGKCNDDIAVAFGQCQGLAQ